MSDFKVKFHGTRGSYPTPAATHLKYGGNTSCVEVNVGKRNIILDCGTGIISLGEDMMRQHILSGNTLFEREPIVATVIISHIHQDHIQGLPFFRPLHVLTSKINIFGPVSKNENLENILSTVLFDKTFPIDLNTLSADIKINNFCESDVIILNADDSVPEFRRIAKGEDLTPKGEEIVISSYKSSAHPRHGTLVIKIAYKDKVLVYATDKEGYIGGDKKFAQFAYGADLLIHDSQYTDEDYLSPLFSKQGYGHSTFKMAIAAARDAKAKKLVYYHFDPSYPDDILEEIEKECISEFPDSVFSRENLIIEI